jgi:cell division protein ZapA
MGKQKYAVVISGIEYTIVSEDSVDHIKRVSNFVDRKLQEIEKTTLYPKQTATVLTALNIADELLKTQDEHTKLRKELSKLQIDANKKGK